MMGIFEGKYIFIVFNIIFDEAFFDNIGVIKRVIKIINDDMAKKDIWKSIERYYARVRYNAGNLN